MTIGRRNVVALLSSACVMSAWASSTMAAEEDLPAAVREANPADASRAAIDKYVDGLITQVITRVKAGDLKSSQSRDQLCRQVESSANVTPSASFQTLYISSALSHLQPLQADPEIIVRLNAAIIVSRLCASTQFSQLTPAVLTALNDKSPAVAIWGIKAAGTLLPGVLAVPMNAKTQKLTTSIVAAVTQLHATGAIVQDAYNALSLPDQLPGVAPTTPTTLGLCATTICDVLDIRIKDYKAGAVINPQADRTGLLFLVRASVLQAMTPPQRLKAIQSISDLLVAAARRAGAETSPNARNDLYEVVSNAAGAMYTAMSTAGNTAAASRYTELLKVPGMMRPDEIVKKGIDALSVVRDTADYKSIKDPAPAN